MSKPRTTPAARRRTRRTREEAACLYDLQALLDALEQDDLLDATAPVCPLFCQGRAQAYIDAVEERIPLNSFNLSNVGPSLPGQK